jgi:hypothetical protein
MERACGIGNLRKSNLSYKHFSKKYIFTLDICHNIGKHIMFLVLIYIICINQL